MGSTTEQARHWFADAWLSARQRLARLHRPVAPAARRAAPSAGASIDPLTGLPTRRGVAAALGNALDRADASGRPVSLIYVGLDGIAEHNDRHGHDAGDALLIEAARRLNAHADGSRLVSRYSGDEFLLVAPCDLDGARRLAAEVLADLARPLHVGADVFELNCSAGVATYPQHGARHQIGSHAVAAMRTAMAQGGGAFAEYDARMGTDLREQHELARDLRDAIQQGQLELFYQPKIDARSLQVTAAEALVRWHHPRHGVVSPATFIPIAERHRLIGEIGNWVLEEAARQAGIWRDRGLRMRVAFNVSAYQMRQDDFIDRLSQALRSNGLQPARFTCEITETVAMEDTRVTQDAFARLGKLGVHVSIDDFGTGHSSLASLRRLPAAELKIDRAFIADLAQSTEARAIVTAVIQMARALGLHVVAEGVEKTEQADLLVRLGCDELQGFLFARPMSARALGIWATDARTPEAIAFRASLFSPTNIKAPA